MKLMEQLLIEKEKQRYSYNQLADAIGYNATAIFRTLTGKNKKLNYDMILKLEKLLLKKEQ